MHNGWIGWLGDENSRNTRQNRVETCISYPTYPRARVSLGGKRFDLPTTLRRGSPYSVSSPTFERAAARDVHAIPLRWRDRILPQAFPPTFSSPPAKGNKRIFAHEPRQLENRGGIEKVKMKFDAVMEEGSDNSLFLKLFTPFNRDSRFDWSSGGERERESGVVDNYFLFRVSVSVISSLLLAIRATEIRIIDCRRGKWFCSRIL